MPKVRYKRLKAVQADLGVLLDAVDRLEERGYSAGHYGEEVARLEARERELMKRIRDGADLHNAVARYQRAKTHCPAGHPYDAGNLIVQKGGYRKCRECNRRMARERRRRINPPEKKANP